MKITKHAQNRIKARCGIPKKGMLKNASLALNEGVCHNETTGRLKKYVDWLFLSHRNGGKIRLFGNHVYIFTTTDKLITVLPLPNIYKNAVNKIQRKKND